MQLCKLDPKLKVADVSKRFGATWALRDVSFDVREGEVLGVIGPNGSGKTTLFECVAGVLPAETGGISFAARPLPASDRKAVLFYLPDGIAPWPSQRAGSVLTFFAGLHGAVPGRSDELTRALGLSALLSTRMGALSKGQRKRVLLALALLTPHPVLLLDEPFDGLDLRQTREAMELLRREAASGRSLVLSIHQLVDAARVSDRLVLLSGGRVAGEGTLEELRKRAGLPGAGLEGVFLALT